MKYYTILNKSFTKKLKLLETRCHGKIIIGGSEALNRFKVISRRVGDLDIIVPGTCYSLIDELRFLSKMYPVESDSNYGELERNYSNYEESDKLKDIEHIRFMLDGFKVCAFITSKPEYLVTSKPITSCPFLFSNPHIPILFKKEYISTWFSKWGVDVIRGKKQIPNYIQKHQKDIDAYEKWAMGYR